MPQGGTLSDGRLVHFPMAGSSVLTGFDVDTQSNIVTKLQLSRYSEVIE